MIKWTADTCTGNTSTGCVILMDMSNPNTPVFSSFERRCVHHSAISGDSLMQTMFTESRKKEHTRQKILETASAIIGETIDGTLTWKKGITFNWSYDNNRILTVSVSGATLTTNQKSTIQTWADNIFGSGKVVVA